MFVLKKWEWNRWWCVIAPSSQSACRHLRRQSLRCFVDFLLAICLLSQWHLWLPVRERFIALCCSVRSSVGQSKLWGGHEAYWNRHCEIRVNRFGLRSCWSQWQHYCCSCAHRLCLKVDRYFAASGSLWSLHCSSLPPHSDYRYRIAKSLRSLDVHRNRTRYHHHRLRTLQDWSASLRRSGCCFEARQKCKHRLQPLQYVLVRYSPIQLVVLSLGSLQQLLNQLEIFDFQPVRVCYWTTAPKTTTLVLLIRSRCGMASRKA